MSYFVWSSVFLRTQNLVFLMQLLLHFKGKNDVMSIFYTTIHKNSLKCAVLVTLKNVLKILMFSAMGGVGRYSVAM